MARKNVPAAEVRAWLNSDAGQAAIAAEVAKNDKFPTKVGLRGRPHPDHRTLYARHNKGKVYEVGSEVEAPQVTVTAVTLDSIGRKTSRKVTVSTAEARTALGQPTDRKGRLPRALLSEALSAQFANEFADQFTGDPA